MGSLSMEDAPWGYQTPEGAMDGGCIKEEFPRLARQFMQDLELYGGEEQVWPADQMCQMWYDVMMCDGFEMVCSKRFDWF